MPSVYLAGRLQRWPVPHFLADLAEAETAVANMDWDQILAQPLLLGPGHPPLRYVDHVSARIIFMATAAGIVRAHGFTFNLIN